MISFKEMPSGIKHTLEVSAVAAVIVTAAGCADDDNGSESYKYDQGKITKIEKVFPNRCRIAVPPGQKYLEVALENRPPRANVDAFKETVEAINGIPDDGALRTRKAGEHGGVVIIPCDIEASSTPGGKVVVFKAPQAA